MPSLRPSLRLLGPLLLALLAGCAGQEDAPTPPSADTSEPPSAISPPLLAYEVDGEIFLADADGDNPVRVTDEVAANGGDSCGGGGGRDQCGRQTGVTSRTGTRERHLSRRSRCARRGRPPGSVGSDSAGTSIGRRTPRASPPGSTSGRRSPSTTLTASGWRSYRHVVSVPATTTPASRLTAGRSSYRTARFQLMAATPS